MRKPTMWFPRISLTQSGLYKHRRWLETGNFGFRKQRNCTIGIAKTKVMISFAVTAPLFSHMQNVSFLMTQLICHSTITLQLYTCK